MTELLRASFAAPLSVSGFMTTRSGGMSQGVYGELNGNNGFNLGANCGDQASAVSANRAALQSQIGYPISWMTQVHGTHVHVVNPTDRISINADSPVVADAMITTATNHALGVLTADCLPVLFASESVIGVAHAGWRGLSAGVLEATLAAMNQMSTDSKNIHAWLGAAIGPTAFEVGEDVLQAFAGVPNRLNYFIPIDGRNGKWWCDLYGLAREQLDAAGIGSVSGGDRCTVSDAARFFSYRRDGQCGRMASVVMRTVD